METHKLGQGLSIIWVDDEHDKQRSKRHHLQDAFGFNKIYMANNMQGLEEALRLANSEGARVAMIISDMLLDGTSHGFSGVDLRKHIEAGEYDRLYPDVSKIPFVIATNNLDYRGRGICKSDLTTLNTNNIDTNAAGITLSNRLADYRKISLPQRHAAPPASELPAGAHSVEEVTHRTRAATKYAGYIDHGDWWIRYLKLEEERKAKAQKENGPDRP